MAAKAIFVICVQTLIVQSVFSQCIGPIIGGLAPALAYDGLFLGPGCGAFTPTASVGGSFVVTSASPVAPTGITVVSENLYEGALIAGGSLPLLGSVGVEGEISTAGAGAVSYGCGDNAVVIAEEVPAGILVPEAVAPGPVLVAPGYNLAAGYGAAAPFGYGYGLGYGFNPYGLNPYGLYGTGCSCGAIY